MTRIVRHILGLALACSAILPAFAQTDPAPPAWCQIDDPANWSAARQALIDAGDRELSNIPCPDRQTGARLPETLTLPMPCDRAMVFRRIDVPVSHLLDQVDGSFGRSVDIAAETPQIVLSNGAWSGPVAGSFSLTRDGEPALSDDLSDLGARAYYIAKYELTAPQWKLHDLGLFDLPADQTATADAAACAPFRAYLDAQDLRKILPAGDLSWFDAIEFGRAYGRWLIARDAAGIAAGQLPDLPWEQGATGYVRLPTEAEWEYAARGGSGQVTAQTRSKRLPMVRDPETGQPRDATLPEVCAEAPRKGQSMLAPVGQNMPNLLGLHDVVCNAEEIVLDLFRPTRPDGRSGQVGGIVTKGGSSIMLRDLNTVGRRSEAQGLFTLSGESRTATMGTRLAISAPVFIGRRDEAAGFAEGRANIPYEQQMLEARRTLLESGVGIASGSSAELSAEVNKLRRAVSEGRMTQSELQDQVAALQIELDRMNVANSQRATESVRMSIRSAVVSANLMDRIGRNMFFAMERIEDWQKNFPDDADIKAKIPQAWAALDMNEGRIQAAFDLYLQVHGTLAQSDAGFVQLQIAESRRGLSGSSVEVFGPYLELFEAHHREIRRSNGQVTETMRATWLGQLDTVRERRLARFSGLRR